LIVLKHKEAFRESLLAWFEEEKEDYPWRRTKDPWAILVSEVMLQQTQVATVLNKGFYDSFLQKFPDVESISKASEQEILKAWEGLGYYRRVRNLQKTAQAVMEKYDGKFPASHKELLALPGIGPYTAGAVGSFAFGLPVELVDANVARLFARIFDYHDFIDDNKGQKQLWSWAEQLLDKERPSAYNSALMELGQKICRSKKPMCVLCPVRTFCKAEHPENLPKKKPKQVTVEVLEQCIWCVKNGLVLLEQQKMGGRREGLWALPVQSVDNRKKPVYQAIYGITHHKVDLRVYAENNGQEAENRAWFPISRLDQVPMPSPFRRAVQTLVSLID
jgi:A/G-specific adenine glycosylase